MSLSSLAQSIVNASEWSHDDPQCRRAHAVAAAAELVAVKLSGATNRTVTDASEDLNVIADNIQAALRNA